MPDFERFSQYYTLADKLISEASNNDLGESLRVLAMNLAQYHASFGELPTKDYVALAKVDEMTPELARALANGMGILVGVVGTITGQINIEIDSSAHQLREDEQSLKAESAFDISH